MDWTRARKGRKAEQKGQHGATCLHTPAPPGRRTQELRKVFLSQPYSEFQALLNCMRLCLKTKPNQTTPKPKKTKLKREKGRKKEGGGCERGRGGLQGPSDPVWTEGRVAYLPDLQFDPLPLYFHSSNLEINSWGKGVSQVSVCECVKRTVGERGGCAGCSAGQTLRE